MGVTWCVVCHNAKFDSQRARLPCAALARAAALCRTASAADAHVPVPAPHPAWQRWLKEKAKEVYGVSDEEVDTVDEQRQ